MLDDEEMYEEQRTATVASEKMLSRYEVPIVYFDAHKNVVTAPDDAQKIVEVQFWSTPIQNKLVYLFDDNVLKIKGVVFNEPKLIHYNQRLYLQSDRQVYQIQPTTDYKRLTETHDVPFM